MRYSYRFLEIVLFDKFFDEKDGSSIYLRRGGDKPDRYLWLRDSTLAEALYFNDERGDDYSDFLARARSEVMKYLDALGSEGWQVSYYSPVKTRVWGSFGNADWPIGTHFLIRSEA